jgi:hypothetical protein
MWWIIIQIIFIANPLLIARAEDKECYDWFRKNKLSDADSDCFKM